MNRVNTVAETLTINYQAVVLNTLANQANQLRNNRATVRSGATVLVTDAAPNITIIEPTPAVAKSATIGGDGIGLPGELVEYTIQITNPVGQVRPMHTI